jgi:hypothetical protein
MAIECKRSAEDIDPRGLKAFLRRYPKSKCRVLTSDVERPYHRRYGNKTVEFVGLDSLVSELVQDR